MPPKLHLHSKDTEIFCGKIQKRKHILKHAIKATIYRLIEREDLAMNAENMYENKYKPDFIKTLTRKMEAVEIKVPNPFQ
jgi:hypothetical protein